MKRIYSLLFLLSFTIGIGQIPGGYYSTATGSGYVLKTQLYNIIKGQTDNGYNGLYTTYLTSDIDNFYENDGTILDMYSENPTGKDPYNYTSGSTQRCGSYSAEGDCYNREHIIPQSVFNSNTPMVSDAHFITPTDGKVNGIRSNYPHGMVVTASQTSKNGSKLGLSTTAGYSGLIFEPIDEFKGDIARMYFYFATRYENTIAGYQYAMFNGTSNQVFTPAFLSQLIAWHNQDPVNEREIARNNAIYARQNNRNPFIDHPEYVQSIWTTGQADTEAPTSVTDLVATNSTSNSIRLQWSAATDNTAVRGYDIYVNAVLKTTVSDLNATIVGLSPSTTYSFYIITKDTSNNASVPSATISESTTQATGGTTTGAEIFFSEYVEGSGNNKIIEITNFTGITKNLSQYSIKKQSNGAGNWSEGISLKGNLNNGSSYVVAYNLAATSCYNPQSADLSTDAVDMQYNGNDPVGLFKNNVLIDIIGTFNGGAANFAADQTLRRKSGVTNPNINFDKAKEWDVYAKDTCDGLGFHGVTLSTPEYNAAAVYFYPNPATTQFSIQFLDGNEPFSIAIYSNLGQKVFEKQNTEAKVFDVRNLLKGIYIVKITKRSKLILKKLIIK